MQPLEWRILLLFILVDGAVCNVSCEDSRIILNNSTPTTPVTLTSMNYPDNYPDNAYCVWFITAEVGSLIAFRFSAFDTEEVYDTVTIGNGHKTSDHDSVIDRLSGILTDLTIFTNDHTAWIKFTSNHLKTRMGFEVTITQERSRVPCGKSNINVNSTQTSVTLHSENYPDNYPYNAYYIWFITADVGSLIAFRFSEFDTEEKHDTVTIGTGHETSDDDSIIDRLSGTLTSPTVFSNDHTAWIQFNSDYSVTRMGFEVTITQVRPRVSCGQNEFVCRNASFGLVCLAANDACVNFPCPDKPDEFICLPCGTERDRDITVNSIQTSVTLHSVNYPGNYPDNVECFWFITADVGSLIAFNFSVFGTEHGYDVVTIGSGHELGDSIVGSFSGFLTSLTVFSNDHRAWIAFMSDNSVTTKGFKVTISQKTSEVSCRQDKEFACQDTSSGLICLSLDDTCDVFPICPDRSDQSNCDESKQQNIYVFKDPVILESPGYQNDLYPNNLNLTWLVKSDSDEIVTMRIEAFNMEANYDYLTVDLLGEGGHTKIELFRLTGESVSRRTVTWDSEVSVLRLEMTTDRSVGQKGFSLRIEHLYDNKNESEVLCHDDEFHCSFGFCVTNSSRCNSYADCPYNEDELNCDNIFCPGSYKCANSSQNYTSQTGVTATGVPHHQAQCIPWTQVCDGDGDCPESDDEIQCDVKRCPTGCKCSYMNANLVVNCNNGWDSSTILSLAPTTHTLQLSGVNISKLDQGMFKAMSYLKVLSLRDNLISQLQEHTFDGLGNLLSLDLSNTTVKELQSSAMKELSSLVGITIFDVPLARIKPKAFSGLGQLKTLIIVRNIKGLPLLQIEDDAFKGLDGVTELYVDDHRICCSFPSSTQCTILEPQPPLFMCSELMPKIVLKVFMWILGISALVGNIFVMVWRCRERTDSRESRVVHSFLVFNLAMSDALMGLYMLIIAGADAYFGKRYFKVSMEWRTSVMCKIAGFISIVSSEASLFFLTVISVNRFLSIRFPFESYHLRPKSSRIVALCVWIGTLIVGLVPTILASDSTSDVYGLSDVCIGLPLMTKVTEYQTESQQIDAGGVANITVEIPYPVEYRASWFFSIALFLGVNLMCFTVILICYIVIFVEVKASSKRVNRHKKRDDEVRMAVKMAAVVLTDFICWIPVIMMGILSQAQVVKIPTEIYAWIVVFILPINSSLNPYLYTIADLCCSANQRKSAPVKRRGLLPMRSTNSESESRNSVVNSGTLETQVDSIVDRERSSMMHM